MDIANVLIETTPGNNVELQVFLCLNILSCWCLLLNVECFCTFFYLNTIILVPFLADSISVRHTGEVG